MPQSSLVQQAYFFRPDLGSLERRLASFTRFLPAGRGSQAYVERTAEEASRSVESESAVERELRWAFSMAILADVVAAGATLRRVDSSIQVVWPDWSSSSGRQSLKDALVRLRDETPPLGTAAGNNELPRALPPDQLVRIMSEGEFRLASPKDPTPHGGTYLEVFQRAKRHWSMPHRDRDARSRPFVLTVQHPTLEFETPVGLLEACDGAPNERVKSELMSLLPHKFLEWISCRADTQSDLSRMETRLQSLFNAVKPVPGLDSPKPRDIYSRYGELESRAGGRSKGTGDVGGEKKRITYLCRLSRGLAALESLRAGRSPVSGDLEALTRSLRDIGLSRLHVDISLCGALPPFSSALGGKLVAAFIADPRIRMICSGRPGEILRRTFVEKRLVPLIPDSGAVLITTKGLYPGHSSQYERAVLPGPGGDGPLRLRKQGETQGITASLISDRSHDIAKRLLEISTGERSISTRRGSGGSRRQRRVQAAIARVRLPMALVEPGIRRPVYAIRLATNCEEIALLNLEPKWACLATQDPEAYAAAAVRVWRDRWGDTAARRAAREGDMVAGLADMLAVEGRGMEEGDQGDCGHS